MNTLSTPLPSSRRGYTSLELLTVMALSALVLGSVVVSYGTIVRTQPRVGSTVAVDLGASRYLNYYGKAGTKRETPSAPHYGMVAMAEELREQFYHDVLSATSVFCLERQSFNEWRPSSIPYDPTVHGELDTSQKFRAHIIAAAAVPITLYRDYRNPENTATTLPWSNASVFILGFSKKANQLKVNAIYDVDVLRFSTGAPLGFHASVKRYAADPAGSTLPLIYSGGYEVFYPPASPDARVANDFTKDDFTPVFITFERASRLALREGTGLDRFKLAAERPFYLLWWPDPAMRHLGEQKNTVHPSLPQQAYNHMAGRTSFMFTVPMFPAL